MTRDELVQALSDEQELHLEAEAKNDSLQEDNAALQEELDNAGGGLRWGILGYWIGVVIGILGCYSVLSVVGKPPATFSFDHLTKLDAIVTERKADLRKLENRLRFWQADAICLLGSPATVTPTRIIAYEDGKIVSDSQYTEIKIEDE